MFLSLTHFFFIQEPSTELRDGLFEWSHKVHVKKGDAHARDIWRHRHGGPGGSRGYVILLLCTTLRIDSPFSFLVAIVAAEDVLKVAAVVLVAAVEVVLMAGVVSIAVMTVETTAVALTTGGTALSDFFLCS